MSMRLWVALALIPIGNGCGDAPTEPAPPASFLKAAALEANGGVVRIIVPPDNGFGELISSLEEDGSVNSLLLKAYFARAQYRQDRALQACWVLSVLEEEASSYPDKKELGGTKTPDLIAAVHRIETQMRCRRGFGT